MKAPRFVAEPGWGAFPPDLVFSEVASVAVGGDLVYLLTRKEPFIVVVDQGGAFVRSWGSDILSFRPHGITVGPDDTVYCVDEAHHLVYRFTMMGELLGSFGPGRPSDTGMDTSIADFTERTASVECSAGPFNHPTALAVGPDSTLYVADGYGNARIHRYSPDFELIDSWGEPGSGPGEFRVPHGVCVDGDGRVLVADRENDRVQIFDADGRYLDMWTDLHRPTDIAIDADGLCFVAEFPSKRGHYSWVHGQLTTPRPARVSVLTAAGDVLDRFGHEGRPWDPGSFAVPHAISIDASGALYVAEVIASTVLYATADDDDWSLPADCHTIQKLSRVAT